MSLARFYSGTLAFLVPSLALAQGSPPGPAPSPSPAPQAEVAPGPAPEATPTVPESAESQEKAEPVALSAPPPAVEPPHGVSDKEAKSEKTTDKEKAKDPIEVTAAPGQGVTFKAGDKFSLNVKSRIQLRYQIADPPGTAEAQQTVNVGTLRVWLGGNILTPNLNYMIQLALAGRDYRDQATSPVYDAFLDWKAHRDISVKVGQYFVPFDRLRTVREFALQLGDRPRPVGELTLDRDVGVSIYSDKFLGDNSPLAYRLGMFGGGGINLSSGKKPGALFVGRLELRPLGGIDDDSEGDLDRREKPGLALGLAGAINLNSNRMRSTTGDTFVGGTTDQYHVATDLVFKWHGFALQGEYLFKQAYDDDIVSTGADGAEVHQVTRSGQGWVAQASYIFATPIELVGRLSGLYAFGGTDPKFVTETDKFGQELAAGVNYYINKHRFKIQADWIARMPHNFDMSVAENTAHVQVDVTF